MTSKIVVNNIEADTGISTITFTNEVTAPTFNGNITGTAATFTTGTFSGNVDIAGALTYEDVTNVDSVGIVTARSGIHVTGGSVGLGTDNPDRPLHVFNGTNDANVKISSTGSGKDARLELIGNNTGTSQIRLGDEASSNVGSITYNHADNSLAFRTNSAERLRIEADGGTIISNAGTFPTSTNETLSIQGEGHNGHGTSNTRSVFNITGAISSNSNAAGLWIGARTNENTAVIGTRTASGNLAFETYSGGWGERLRITSDGQVFIGKSDQVSHPNMDDLQIGDSTGNRGITISSATTGYGTVAFGDSADGSGTDRYAGFVEYYHNDNSMRLGTSSAERLRITSGGQLKLGSNTLVTPNTNADNFVIDTGDADSGLSILSTTTGRIYFGDAGLTDAGSIRYVHTDNSMRFETNSAERLRIDSAGIIKTPNLNGNNYREIHRQITGFSGGGSVVNYLLVCETSRSNVRLVGRLLTARASGTSASTAQMFDITFQTNHNATHRSGAIMGLHAGSPSSYAHAVAEFVSLTYNSTNYYAIRFSGLNSGWPTDFDACSFDGIREHVGTELFTQLDTATDSISNVSVLTGAGGNAGDVTIQQADLRISDGDIIMPSGHGIHFGASTGSGSTSPVLDDYEEGTFTATCNNSITLYSNSNLCQYIKIGSMVTVMGQIRVDGSNGGAALGINNLPFTVYNGGEAAGYAVGSVRLYAADMASDHKYVICLGDMGTSNLLFQGVRDNATAQNLGADSNGYYMFTLTYRTST